MEGLLSTGPRPRLVSSSPGKKTSLTVEENGEIIKEKMSLTRKKKGDILRVDVPAHGQFQPLTVIVAANTKGDWHTKVRTMKKERKKKHIFHISGICIV